MPLIMTVWAIALRSLKTTQVHLSNSFQGGGYKACFVCAFTKKYHHVNVLNDILKFRRKNVDDVFYYSEIQMLLFSVPPWQRRLCFW